MNGIVTGYTIRVGVSPRPGKEAVIITIQHDNSREVTRTYSPELHEDVVAAFNEQRPINGMIREL